MVSVLRRWCGMMALCTVVSSAFGQTPTTFTYQGELTQSGGAANGAYDMQFRLFNALSGPSQLGSTVCLNDVPVTAGRFAVPLDFGAQFFGTGARYLEIDVRPGAGVTCSTTSGYTTLAPRQSITAVPRAMTAQSAAQLVSPLGTSAVQVDTLGRVGIGTPSPLTSLHVVTQSTGEGMRIQGPSGSVANMAWLGFNNSSGTQIGYVGDGSTGDNNVFLYSNFADVSLGTSAGRVLNATNLGRVGIMTPTPQATLDVNGNIRVAPTDRWKSYHGSAFIPQYLNSPSFGTQGGLGVIDSFGTANSGTVGYTGSTAPALFFAPVDLPDGCTVVDVCVDARDQHSGVDISVSFGKISLSSGFVTEVATTFTGGSGGTIQRACNGVVNDVIDNANYVYFLRARMATNGSSIHWLLAARLKYRVTSPLP